MNTRWYYKNELSQVGPMIEADLKRHATAGKILPDTLVRKGENGKWHAARNIKGLLRDSTSSPDILPVIPSKALGPSFALQREVDEKTHPPQVATSELLHFTDHNAEPRRPATNKQSPVFLVGLGVVGTLFVLGVMAATFLMFGNMNENSSRRQQINRNIPETGNESPRVVEVQALRKSLESFRDNCNSRIESVEARFGKKSPVHLTPGKLDLRRTDSALRPYNGVLTLLIATEGALKSTREYEFQFTLEPADDDEWKFVSCYGGPVTGTSSEWTLKSLSNNYESRIGMAWILGYDEATNLLEPYRIW